MSDHEITIHLRIPSAPTRRGLAALTAGLLLIGAVAEAAPLSLQYFSKGDLVSAAAINQNFKTLGDGLDDAQKRLDAYGSVEPDFEVASGGETYGLQNGWSLWPDDAFAHPGYFRDPSGVVHLEGLLGNGPAGKTAFVLKPGYAPARNRIFTSGGGSGCEIRVFANGEVQPQSNCPSNAWFSLDTISFRSPG